ncbi:MAG: CoA transferase [Acetobacteraceae bacterium]|nr:CoA transferase [Acetobacteraceae bacterium]
MSTGFGPLDGLRVIDASNFLAAPTISMHLADLGAEVIKIERPDGGDEFRQWGHSKGGVGLYAKVVNRNKKSVTADLRAPLGVEIVKRLVRDADLIVENYRPGTFERWGLGYEVLSAINPRLVMLRVTGYGQEGPNAGKPGFGTALEGYAGFVHINGEADGSPLLPPFGMADASSGLCGAFLALAALRERDRSGRGQVVDLALYEAMFAMLGPLVVDYDQLGLVQGRVGSRLPWVAPRNTYVCADGTWVSLSASSNGTFVRLCGALGIPELAEDPRFEGNRARIANVEALDAALQAAIRRFPRDELIRLIEASDAVVSPVNDVRDILADAHIRARGSVIAVPDAELGGPIRMQAPSGRFSRTPAEVRHAGPRIGEHNREVLLDELGLDEAALRDAGYPL